MDHRTAIRTKDCRCIYHTIPAYGYTLDHLLTKVGKSKGKVCIRAKVAHQAGAYPGFRSMKRLGVFLLPPGWDASPSQGYPPALFASTHLYTWVERGTVRVKCLAQEHNTVSPARARTRTNRSGDERTNHEATAPPTKVVNNIICQKKCTSF